MTALEVVDLTSDDEHDDGPIKVVKFERGVAGFEKEKYQKAHLGLPHVVKTENPVGKNQDSFTFAGGQSKDSVLEQASSPVDDSSLTSSSARRPAPICRQFWKAGNYSDVISPRSTLLNGDTGVHIHPMFLHSNATSHRWAFGAVAELVDNAFDEIQNGATYVIVDKVVNPRDGSPALLIRDDGQGMDPDAMRRCMSFGFSDKKSGIGQYGNGFKTSTMRLGSDVIVFSRHLNNGELTQSIGLLSYTFLTQTGRNRIVVPMVTYQFNAKTKNLEPQYRFGKDHFKINLSVLLQWSPYSTEADLRSQFNDIGYHGTKVIVYNLWHDDDGKLELDFNTNSEDIVLSGVARKIITLSSRKEKNEAHVSNQLQHSLRAYLSILYLRVPENFRIILRGRDVDNYNIAADLKHPEFIMYKPHSAGHLEGSVLTSIGFLKDAPDVVTHGFNVYHKNRLILPFWRVIGGDRCRGVVGVLEANFIEPTHNKQEFERTSLFQKLETRLRLMTGEYWEMHAHLIGYRRRRTTEKPMKDSLLASQGIYNPTQPVSLAVGRAASQTPPANPTEPRTFAQAASLKRSRQDHLPDSRNAKRKAVLDAVATNPSKVVANLKPVSNLSNQLSNPENAGLLQERQKLQIKCSEFEKEEKELESKVERLKSELLLVQREYKRLQEEADSLAALKIE